jgi:hypothetical protein
MARFAGGFRVLRVLDNGFTFLNLEVRCEGSSPSSAPR